MWYGNGMGGWGLALMTVSNLLFWGLVIAGIIALVRYTRRGEQTGIPTGDGPRRSGCSPNGSPGARSTRKSTHGACTY